jgi:tetratricopeptide (TPR) repeat protein
LATAHSRQAQAWVSLGKLDEAQQAYEQAFAVYTTQLEKDPRNAGWRDDLSDLHAELGWIQECRGHFAEALGHHQANLEISQGLVAEGEKREGWQRDLALAHFDLGRVLLAQGHLDDARPHLEEALQTFRQQVDVERPGSLLDCAGAMAMMIRACTQLGDLEQAAKLSEDMAALNWRAESADSPSRARMLAAIGLEQ